MPWGWRFHIRFEPYGSARTGACRILSDAARLGHALFGAAARPVAARCGGARRLLPGRCPCGRAEGEPSGCWGADAPRGAAAGIDGADPGLRGSRAHAGPSARRRNPAQEPRRGRRRARRRHAADRAVARASVGARRVGGRGMTEEGARRRSARRRRGVQKIRRRPRSSLRRPCEPIAIPTPEQIEAICGAAHTPERYESDHGELR